MSAIAGIIHFNNEPIPIEHGRGLMGALEKFPADDVQTLHKENVFLGCHAQWITPESIGEQLPFYDYGRQLAITADAIIDNREELFERLQLEQEDRKKITDSQLILLAYHRWGKELPKFLVGDFAFMIWDDKEKQLFGASDFTGTRTLYYNHTKMAFAFCTTIQPLLTLPYIKKEIDEQWLAEFLVLPHMFDTTNAFSTVYENIEQVPPSHSIVVKENKVRLSRYNRITCGKQLNLRSNQEYEEAFRDVFQRAVNDRLRTHHKIGAHLSGGLDSGSVVSFASKSLLNRKKQLYTFSYIPPKDFIDWTPRYKVADESPYIQSTVNYVGNIKDYYLDFDGKSPFSEIDDWLDILEMPYKFFENSFWLKGIYDYASQQGVGVLLNGKQGNYSISWGPALDYQANLLKKFKWIRFYRELYQYSQNIGVKKSRVFSIVGKKAFPFINRIIPSESQYRFPLMINPQFARKTNILNKLSEQDIDITGDTILDGYEARKQKFEQLYYLNIGKASGTKLSLRYSLWERDPTNDIRVILFCLSVPDEQYVQNGLDRALIRRSTKNLLPDKVRLNQRIKGIQGSDGIHRMLPNWNVFVEELRQLSNDQKISEFLNMEVINNAISRFSEKPAAAAIFDEEFNVLMRSLIVHRFLKNKT